MLPSRTIAAGSSMAGHVIVENHTSDAIRVVGCLSIFQVLLQNDTAHQSAFWLDCAQPFTIPRGSTSYPVMITATYTGCSTTGSSLTGPACLPNGRIPPLPPGKYEARLAEETDTFPKPPPLTITVTP